VAVRHHPLFRKWTNIQEIFNRPAHKQYATCYTQGWTCDWDDFTSFARDVERKLGLPQPGQLLIRKDQSRGWTLNNLIYGDAHLRGNKQRTCRRITIKGRTHTLKEWTEIRGLKYGTVYSRIRNYGLTPAEALEIKVRPNGKK
jgi:hypothetical protein